MLTNIAQRLYAKWTVMNNDEEGATAVEYAVMLGVVIAVSAAVLGSVGIEIKRIWELVLDLLKLVKAPA